MKKADQNCLDSVDTNNDSPDNPMVSFHLRHNLSASKVQKIDQYTITDQLLTNCSCEQIPKLKQKAHKSFMQVIQIENLYKEQIAQLKQYFGERQKNKDKQYKYKQQLLNEKCKQLQAQVQKVKKTYNLQKAYQIQIQSNPFTIDNIQNISYNALLDQSSSSIFNLKQFVNKKNISQLSTSFQNQLKQKLQQILREQNLQNIKKKVSKCQQTVIKVFQFVRELKDQTIIAYEKYNEIIKNNGQSQGKYSKLVIAYQSVQKQVKFMTDHIKRLSKQKIQMQKKFNQLQRSNKALQEYIKHLKKINQSQKRSSVGKRKQSDSSNQKDVVYFNQQGQLEVSINSLIQQKKYKKQVVRGSAPVVDTTQQGFKKKNTLFQRIQK